METPARRDIVQANVVCPADTVFGVQRHHREDGSRWFTLQPGPRTLGFDGHPAPGLLFIAGDMSVGHGAMSTVGSREVIVTTSMHLELHTRPFEDGTPLEVLPSTGHRYHGGAAGVGSLRSGTGVTASVTGRFAILSLGTRAAGNIADTPTDVAPNDDTPAEAAHEPHPLIDAPIYRTLGTRVVEAGEREVTLAYCAAPELANERRGVHGGVGALMGERACDTLLRTVARPGIDLRPVTMSTAFLRPLAADHSTVQCVARVEHAGRQLVVVQATLHTADGKPAVVVDLVAAGVPTD